MLTPASLAELQQIIADAADTGEQLEVVGGGSKRWYGRRVAARDTLSLAGFAGVVDYQPEELICIAKPATPLHALEKLLEEKGQMLAFEPPHWGDSATLGGTIACNQSGPRRFKAGAARDHLLGFQAVTGRGDAVRGGGKVVKNVTGYDLSKLMCGSFGTLGVFTELCVKVLPRPETERTVVVRGMEEAEALTLLRDISRTPHEPSGLACLPTGFPMPPSLLGFQGNPKPMALIRIEGPERSVGQRVEAVASMAKGQAIPLERIQSRGLWRALRELEGMHLAPGQRLWRVSVPPDRGQQVMDALRRVGSVRGFYDWGGGLVWAILPASADGAVHPAALAAGGHARVLRNAAGVAAANDVFGPLPEAQRKIHDQLKQAFDPSGILNPGRMYAGI
ncbi:MAG TPA: glycolate oxidase subunit GlcE [bacterium]